MTAASKIPPQVARELRRHIAKKGDSVMRTNVMSQQQQQQQPRRSSAVLYGTLGFLGFAFSMPFLAMKWIGRLNDKEEPLTAAQVRRGAFNNSGSKDAGIDPNWDFSTGRYKKNKELEELFAKDDPNQLDHGEKFMYRR